jgi:hypothetical protein
MDFLVCRKDALRPNPRMRTSDFFPMVISYEWHPGTTYEDIVRDALDSIKQGYVGMHEYIVVPLENAHIVSFKPRHDYYTEIRRWKN